MEGEREDLELERSQGCVTVTGDYTASWGTLSQGQAATGDEGPMWNQGQDMCHVDQGSVCDQVKAQCVTRLRPESLCPNQSSVCNLSWCSLSSLLPVHTRLGSPWGLLDVLG